MKCGKKHVVWNEGIRGVQIGYWKGKNLSDEIREKISISTKRAMRTLVVRRKFLEGIKNRRDYSKKDNPFWGKTKVAWNRGLTKVMDDRVRRSSESLKKRYEDGEFVYEDVYDVEFDRMLKNKIKKRDGYRCKECGVPEKEEKLYVHHIDYDKKNSKEDNLVTLCGRCHGRTNWKREDWMRYFKGMVRENCGFLEKEVN